MKPAQSLLVLMLLFSFYAKAQKEVIFQGKPLVLVNNFKTNLNNFIIRPASIEAIDVIKDSLKTKTYGDEGKNGIIIITPKKEAILLTAKDIINKYKITTNESKLRFAIDKTIIGDQSKILIEQE